MTAANVVDAQDAPTFDERFADVEAQYAPPKYALRDLANEAITLDILLTAAEGELTPELEARMDALTDALIAKVDGIGDYRQAMLQEIADFSAEEKRLQGVRKRREAALARFETRVREHMERMDRLKIPGKFWTLSVRANPHKLIVTDESSIPAVYKTKEEVILINNAQLERDLQLQEQLQIEAAEARAANPDAPQAELPAPIPGAHLERGKSLVVK